MKTLLIILTILLACAVGHGAEYTQEKHYQNYTVHTYRMYGKEIENMVRGWLEKKGIKLPQGKAEIELHDKWDDPAAYNTHYGLITFTIKEKHSK